MCEGIYFSDVFVIEPFLLVVQHFLGSFEQIFCYRHLVWLALSITFHAINVPDAGHTLKDNLLIIQVAD